MSKIDEILNGLKVSSTGEVIYDFPKATGNFTDEIERKAFKQSLLKEVLECLGEDEKVEAHTDIISEPGRALENHHRIARNLLRLELRQKITELFK